jgi:hypothetical protein
MSFWDIVWFIFITWVFVAYLMVLFRIIGDIFRDQELSGVWKAVWMIALIFMPFLTAVVYLISRGRSMAERSMRAAAMQREQQEAYIRDIARHDIARQASPADQITQARALLDDGTISQQEFDALKTKALAPA